MYINNKCAWIEWFSVANITLESNTGLSRSGIIKARNALKQYGIIDFKTNGTKATNYKLFSLIKSDVAKSNQAESDMVKSVQDITKSTQAEDTISKSTQNGVQNGVQVSTQDGVQDGVTLNKRNENINDLFNSLLKNARDKFDVSNFGGKIKALCWAKEQEEWNDIPYDIQCTFIHVV